MCGSTDPPVRCADAARRGRLKARHDEDWFFRALVVVPVTAFALMAGLSAAGQRTPAAGEPWDLARTPDGQPDIQGFWRDQEGGLSGCSLETGFCNQDNARLLGIRDGLQAVRKAITTGKPVTAIIDPPDGKIPYQPWAAAVREERRNWYTQSSPSSARDINPELSCVLGLPRLNYFPEFQIVQAPGYVLMLWERTRAYRIIPLVTRPRIPEHIKLLMGDARGRWEGNTLVVETTNFNDWSWIDGQASLHSDAMTLLERYTYADANTLHYQATVADPKVFTRPWTFVMTIKRTHGPEDGYEFMEYACAEGERSLNKLLRDKAK